MKLFILISLTAVLFQLQPAYARKVALVIGNSAYAEGPLRNPVNDARLMEKTLRPLGFEVKRLENLDYRGMKRAIIDFGNSAKDAEVALVYYAGHGMQQDGENWLIPTDAKISKPADVGLEALQASSLLHQLEDSRAKIGLVILDACRNNPFVSRTRSTSRGLARMDAPSGSIVAYAAQPGAVADDGVGNNGLYTKHLAANLARKDLEIKKVFELTAIAVEKESGRSQRPREDIGLRGDFYLFGVPAPDAPSTQTLAAQEPREPAPIQQASIAPSTFGSAAASTGALAKFGIEMVSIPAGSFLTRIGTAGSIMSMADALGRRSGELSNESKQMNVEAFELGATEVTNGQWRKVMGEEPRPGGGDDNPVLGRTWAQTQEFIQRLNAATGETFRLPSEVEWEYAARAGCDAPFNIGGQCKEDIVKGVDAMFSDGGFFEVNRSVPVKSYPANGFGLYGMHGNESEWMNDCLQLSASEPPDCSKRIVRGGSMNDRKVSLRATNRSYFHAITPMAGFRLAK